MTNQNPEEFKSVLKRFKDGYPAIIDCGPGWNQLIIDCDLELAALDPDYSIYQIKEKFGTLRYYFDTSPETSSGDRSYSPFRMKMNYIVGTYESVSAYKCETCGEMGADLTKVSSRYQTLCKKCLAKLDPVVD